MAIKMERIVKNYYDELDNGKILGRKCQCCGSWQFPPRIACTTCGSMDEKWEEISGGGTLTDITKVSRMTGKNTEVYAPFVMGCVDLDEGPEINAIIRGVTNEMADEIREKLPLPVNAEIFQLENHKTIVFKLS